MWIKGVDPNYIISWIHQTPGDLDLHLTFEEQIFDKVTHTVCYNIIFIN